MIKWKLEMLASNQKKLAQVSRESVSILNVTRIDLVKNR